MSSTRAHHPAITPRGLARLREELRRLLFAPIPPAAPLGTSEQRALSAGLGARIARLDRRIAHAEHARPRPTRERIDFGADVLLIDDQGASLRVTIVGDDEARPGSGSIALSSDAAQALLGRSAGEAVYLRILRFHRWTPEDDGSGELSYAYRRYLIAAFDYP